MKHPTKNLYPLPQVTEEVLETVKQACLACVGRERDIFSTCLRLQGASGVQVTSVLHFLMPNISDTEPVSIQQLLDAIQVHQTTAKAAWQLRSCKTELAAIGGDSHVPAFSFVFQSILGFSSKKSWISLQIYLYLI